MYFLQRESQLNFGRGDTGFEEDFDGSGQGKRIMAHHIKT